MLNKLSATLVAALAITAEAAHAKHQHFRRHYGPGYDLLNNSVTSVAPLPSTLASSLPIPLSSAPSGTGSNPNSLPSVPVPLSTAPSAITVLSTSSVLNTVSTAVEFPSNSIPLGTGPRGPPYPTTVKSGSISQGPSGTAPLGTGATESSNPVEPEIPGKAGHETPEASGKFGNGVPESSGKIGSEIPKASVKVETSAKVTVVTSESAFATTIGTGSHTTVLTTTVKRTSTRTLLQTIYATPAPTMVTEKGAIGATGTPEEPTTTIISTITSTRVVILEPFPSGAAPNGGKGFNEGETPKGGEASKGGNDRVVISGDSCSSKVTVTVTKAPVTVTVTANPSPAKASPAEEAPSSATPLAESSAVEEASSSTTPSLAESSAAEEPASSSALPSFSSAPFNNGTNAVTSITQSIYPSSGFLTRTSASFTLRPSASGAYHQ